MGGAPAGGESAKEMLRVLQLNVWHDAQHVTDGLQLVADIIVGSDADVVTFSGVRNTSDIDFLDTLKEILTKRGHSFYGDPWGYLVA